MSGNNTSCEVISCQTRLDDDEAYMSFHFDRHIIYSDHPSVLYLLLGACRRSNKYILWYFFPHWRLNPISFAHEMGMLTMTRDSRLSPGPFQSKSNDRLFQIYYF
jgi:hypothetical protein